MKLFELMHFLEHLPSRYRRSIILFFDFLIFYLGSFLAEIVIYKSWDYFANLTVALYMSILSTASVLLIYIFGIYRNKTKFITAKIIPKLLVISFLSSTILFVFDSFVQILDYFQKHCCSLHFWAHQNLSIRFLKHYSLRTHLFLKITSCKDHLELIIRSWNYSEKPLD